MLHKQGKNITEPQSVTTVGYSFCGQP